MPLLGLAAWAGGLLAIAPLVVGVATMTLVATSAAIAHRRGSARSLLRMMVAALLVAGAVLVATHLRQGAIGAGPVADLADQGAAVEVMAVVVSDPRPVEGRFADQVAVRLSVRVVVGRGWRHDVRSPVLLLGDHAWSAVQLGATVRTWGRLSDADDPGLAGILTRAAAPTVLSEPDVWWSASGALRASIRDAVSHRPADQRALVPALVDGDDAGLDSALEDDFRTTGLTHLTAVSGTNLTLVVGFLLIVAGWCRVRGRWLLVVAACGIVGFVLLARTEPSVLRAAAMGSVGVLALGRNGEQRALRALGVAMVILLLAQPALAASAGFALSVLATGGIVLLAPRWRDALVMRMPRCPRWLAEAIAVPTAAQLACTPVVAGLSGQVSLVAVVANLLVAPVVGPATVLGLAAGVVGLLVPPAGAVLGTGAGWCVGWIATVARTGADVPMAAMSWSTGLLGLAALVLVCATLAVVGPRLIARSGSWLLVSTLLAAVLTARMPATIAGWNWPGNDWVLAMCDVGQGDALVLRAGPNRGVVVDAGPDPRAVDACLDRLEIDQVPVLVLTHFHADHVDGLAGVLSGRRVGQVWTTTLLDPPEAVAAASDALAEVGVVPAPAPEGTQRVGDVVLQHLWPHGGETRPGPGDGSTANDASVVLLAEVRGVRVLLTGDLEPPGQTVLARELPGLVVDVLKVPHHGSRYQDSTWLASLQPDAALISVGAENDYGHPAESVIEALEVGGVDVARTDQDGDVLVELDRDGSPSLRHG